MVKICFFEDAIALETYRSDEGVKEEIGLSTGEGLSVLVASPESFFWYRLSREVGFIALRVGIGYVFRILLTHTVLPGGLPDL